uniref:Uncharacterized protein n=1 Tax=Ananas comosus var. bracteatus TaxID=296719 RepID=A0A6V7PG00_ANACO|nr:unnamed protein product [Ananas comosus var. bracteatus]
MVNMQSQPPSDENEVPTTEQEICAQVLGTRYGYISGRGHGPKPKSRREVSENQSSQLQEELTNTKTVLETQQSQIETQQSQIETQQSQIETQQSQIEAQQSPLYVQGITIYTMHKVPPGTTFNKDCIKKPTQGTAISDLGGRALSTELRHFSRRRAAHPTMPLDSVLSQSTADNLRSVRLEAKDVSHAPQP